MSLAWRYSVTTMSGRAQAMFVRCREIAALEQAVTEVLDAEGFSSSARRLHLGLVSRSRRGFAIVLPGIPDFFLERDAAGSLRLARLARRMRAPIYDVEVRDGVAVTLIEADALGRVRISGAPPFDVGWEREVASRDVDFGLLPVPAAVHQVLAEGDRGGNELAEYLGGLAGFPRWIREPDALETDEIAFVQTKRRR